MIRVNPSDPWLVVSFQGPWFRPWPGCATVSPNFEAAVAGRMVTFDASMSHRDGSLRFVRVTCVPHVLRGGRVEGVIALMADVTAERRAEEERAALLAREQAARAEAEAANRAKDEFLAIVSHELRTPLTAILGWLHLLKRGKLDGEKRGRAIETIERNAKTQAQLIDDLLEVSRIVAGKLSLEVRLVPLAPVVEAAIEAVRPSAEAKGVALAFESDPAAGTAPADPARLQQVFWNLLANAVKFTPAGGRIDVRIARAGASARVTVRDTGKGIEPALLPYLFDRFRQADSSSRREHGGLGLGLAIARHLVEAHGGTVAAASEGPGKGATFTVELPLAAGSSHDGVHPEIEGENAGGVRLEGRRVLVVDDDPDARELVATILAQQGAVVSAAASAGEALAVLGRTPQDVLISDLGMPGEDGFDLIRKVRANKSDGAGARLPAIALTAYAREEDRHLAQAAGFEVHLPKPIEPGRLVRAVAGVIADARSGARAGAPF